MTEVDRVLRDQIALVTHAAGFAARMHAGQTRKGESGPAYILHLAEVADLLAKALEEPDAELVAAAWRTTPSRRPRSPARRSRASSAHAWHPSSPK